MSQSYLLRARPSIGALATAAILTVLGAVGMVTGSAEGWQSGWVTLAGVIFGLGLVLAGLILVLTRRHAVRILLDDHGYRLSQAGQVVVGDWADVAKVTAADDHVILVGKEGPDSGQMIISPRGPADPQFIALLRALGPLLDRHRGYQSL